MEKRMTFTIFQRDGPSNNLLVHLLLPDSSTHPPPVNHPAEEQASSQRFLHQYCLAETTVCGVCAYVCVCV